jgi:hypothetical protein
MTAKYHGDHDIDLQSPSSRIKMQFEVITTILFFFAAQTVATPNLQARDAAIAAKLCSLAFMALCQGKLIMIISCDYLRL